MYKQKCNTLPLCGGYTSFSFFLIVGFLFFLGILPFNILPVATLSKLGPWRSNEEMRGQQSGDGSVRTSRFRWIFHK